MISPHVFAQTEAIKRTALPFLVGATNAQVTAQGVSWLFRIHVHDGHLADLVPRSLVETLGKRKPGSSRLPMISASPPRRGPAR